MAKKTFLDFEQPIADLESKIEELRYVQTESAVDISAEIDQLAKKSQQLTKDIYSDLTPWQINGSIEQPSLTEHRLPWWFAHEVPLRWLPVYEHRGVQPP